MGESAPRARVGTSGWNYSHWRGDFYPAGLPTARWFGHYAARFDTVEINNTFYQLPAAATMRAWRAQAPRDFCYAVKANRYLTHVKRLGERGEPLRRFLGRVRLLGTHLGPILYQLPPRWRCNVDRLASFLAALPTDLVHVFEFRDPSWHCEEVFRLLETHGASLCVHDMPSSGCPRRAVGPVVYLRFHGAEKKYQGGYPRRSLATCARWLRSHERPIYVYFNNDVGGHAPRDARWFRRHLETPA